MHFKKIIICIALIISFGILTSCGSVNFPPGKATIGADGGDGF